MERHRTNRYLSGTIFETAPKQRLEKKAVSVKTASDIPKEKMEECVRQLKDVTVCAPVHIGDVILENAAGCGVPIVATRNVERKQS